MFEPRQGSIFVYAFLKISRTFYWMYVCMYVCIGSSCVFGNSEYNVIYRVRSVILKNYFSFFILLTKVIVGMKILKLNRIEQKKTE